MNVDAAVGGALMNKKYTTTYGLIEDMAQNNYQWTSERAISLLLLLHPLKTRQLSVSAVTPAPVSPPCEICGIFGHIGGESQLGSAIESTEKLNYDQYNQGMRPNQNFYKTPQNPFGQTTPPGYANNQGVPQKSSLELLMENYVINQPKQLQELKNQTGLLNDSLVKLTSKVDSIYTHNKMLETQISQIAQQMATSSQTPEIFPGQTEANRKGLINAITLRDGKQSEDLVVKTKTIEGEIESEKPQSEKAIGESDKLIVSPPYKLKFLSHKGLLSLTLEVPGVFSSLV
ncbi:hypothetical protein MTR_6g052950 [Medicago truncatula]|uniref:Uncharacterized protein n=1 Tax=Medicago truncatula TaxID=3880 RepID=A0A072U995_MEDTR|nr:hypothetical protein MTR_6g052950 [Medicago truncatula]